MLTAVVLTVGMALHAADEPITAIITSSSARTGYLAHATIWTDPGNVTPEDLLSGPPGLFPYSPAEAMAGVRCTFTQPGKELGGKSAKFLCRTGDGHTLRLKYWDAERAKGNREVFATVAATRLMWALGFDVLQTMPINVECDGCPANPMTGDGKRATRTYVAEISVYPPSGPKILSRNDTDQGWSWRELDDAIKTLPPGPERARQRTQFDALTLLGVLLQHGDRKPEQQALYCAAPVELRAVRSDATKTGEARLVVERPDASACPKVAVVVVDVGATFGGAGRTSNNDTAKMSLGEWRKKRVFKAESDGTCRGELAVSLAAGHDGEGDPEIFEDGRRFLVEQLHRLTPAHIRAIFTAARVDLLGPHGDQAATAGPSVTDEWVEAFQDKVRQIESRQCRSTSQR